MKTQVQPHLIALAEGVNITLDKPIILIGRHQECDIQIPSRKISRRHCCIAIVNDHLVIRDLGSTNGIRINGVKVVEGQLQADDEVTIGNMRYQLRYFAEGETQRAPVQNGIKPQTVGAESSEEPMLLTDVAKAHPVLPPAPRSLEIPEAGDVRLAPLDPSSPG